MSDIVRVNMSNARISREDFPQKNLLLGGRGLIAHIMNAEVPPTCDPWGAHNKLIIATGFFSGTEAVCSSRISVGGKSPLTGGIKEANAGGVSGHMLGRLGIKAIILESQPQNKNIYVLKISKAGAELIVASELSGLGNYAVVDKLRAQYGKEVGILSIGTAGERRFANSTVAVTDVKGRPCRHAARGGLGSVMGSKGIKAVVIDDADTSPILLKDEGTFHEAVHEHARMLREDKGLIKLVSTYGIAGAVNLVNAMGALPTFNFRSGNFAGADKISGEKMAALREVRGGKMHACMPTCIIACSPIFLNEKGEYITSAFEYESPAMLGANLGIDDIDAIAEMDRLCDDFGLDTIETGGTLAVAAEAGLMNFGDSKKARALIMEMGEATLLGRILGQGAVIAARVLGVSRVAAVKGQAMSAHEPRVFKATGVTLATSPMGADHTAGMAFDASITRENAIAVSRESQIICALVDSTGCCQIAYGIPGTAVPLIQKMLNARYGFAITKDEVFRIGMSVLKEEERFNRAAGITQAANKLPEFFRTESLPPTNNIFDLSEKNLQEIFSDLL